MNRVWVRAAALMATPLLLAACSSSTSDSGSSSAASSPAASSAAASSPAADNSAGNASAPLPTGGLPLADTKWALTGASWTTEDLAAYGITLEFSADTASGFGGVNQYNASYTSDTKGELKFGEIASTKMAGDEAAMEAETQYLAALKTVTSYGTSGELLDLFAGPDQILTFKKQ